MDLDTIGKKLKLTPDYQPPKKEIPRNIKVHGGIDNIGNHVEVSKNQDPPAKPPKEKAVAKQSSGPLIEKFNLKRKAYLRPKYSSENNKIKIKKKIYRNFDWIFQLLVISLIIVLLGGFLYNSRLGTLARLALNSRNKNILIGFQNSAELRPTGGFWGSFAVLKTKQDLRKSELLFETNPYKNDNPLLKKTDVPLPKPMAQTWSDRPQSFVNANWPFDFPETAKTIQWYYGLGWQQPTDAVVAVSSLTMIDLLKLTGPVTAQDGTEISAENFTEVMQDKIEREYFLSEENKKINEPKTIIKELAPQIIEKTKKINKFKLYSFFIKQVTKGRITAFYSDTKSESLVKKIQMDGRSLEYATDYLSINNANLNGGKTSLKIDQSISYQVKKEDGKILATLKITRDYPPGDTGVNQNYTRIIVPLGSKLIYSEQEKEKLEVDVLDEFGKTTFGFWNTVGSGEGKSSTLTYELPFTNIDSYSLIYQKQLGTMPDQLEIELFGRKIFDSKIDQVSKKF